MIKVLGFFPAFVPALVAKAETHAALGDWEAAADAAARCLAEDVHCLKVRARSADRGKGGGGRRFRACLAIAGGGWQ